MNDHGESSLSIEFRLVALLLLTVPEIHVVVIVTGKAVAPGISA
jgi:hypothetical protein